MIELVGNYLLGVKFGGLEIPLAPDILHECTIVQDMKKFLPMFRLTFSDPTAAFTHLLPMDNQIGTIYIELGTSFSEDPENTFVFEAFRRFPEEENRPQNVFDVTGLLNLWKELFVKTYSRGWTGMVKQVLENIGKEIGCDEVEVSSSLNYKMNLVQPAITNAKFLSDLKKRIYGKNGEYAFQCFIKREKGKSVFVFKSLKEFVSQDVRKKYIVADVPFEDREPLFNYKIIDNYKLVSGFASKNQAFRYFDWEKGQWVESLVSYDEFVSLTEYLLIDREEDTSLMIDFGRTNQFDYREVSKSDFYERLNHLSKMWVTAPGDSRIVPGDVVDILFPEGLTTGEVFVFQYAGLWLVERVVHTVVDTHRTKLLLTRAGIDTSSDTSLVRVSENRRRR